MTDKDDHTYEYKTVTPPPKEVMDKHVGHWESVPGTKWIGCIPIKVDAKINIYAPTGDEDVYLDETEVRNVDYLEYLFWLERVYGSNYDNGSYPEVYWNALPDTNVWRDKLAYNEPLVEHYLRHPAYNNYPVVDNKSVQVVGDAQWYGDLFAFSSHWSSVVFCSNFSH